MKGGGLMEAHRRRGGFSRFLTALNAVLYALCGLIWLHRGLRDPAGPNRFYVVLALAWLAGAVIWAVRAWRERKKEEP